MRVLYLSPSAELGGAERALLEGIRALRSLEPSWTLGLFSLEDGPLVAEARSLGVDATVLPVPEVLAAAGESGRRRTATLLQLTRGAGPIATYARAFRKHVSTWAADVVHSNGIKTHVLGAWSHRHTPLVWHVHDYLSTRGVSATLLRHHRRSVAVVLANSQSVAADVTTLLGSGVQVQTVYNAIDIERFTAEGRRLDLDQLSALSPAAPDAVRIGLVATFARWKGHDTFLQALAQLNARQRVRAYVIGGPVYRTGAASQVSQRELQARVRDLGLEGHVGFTGFINDPSDAYRALDVVVHASTSPEPFGLSIAEAMACERAVIISDAGGAREVGQAERTCLAHPPGDVLALARQLSRLIDDATLRTRLGRAAADFVRRRFTPERLGESLRSVYGQLAGAGARA
jgi:glycosyltransferase involved in cell wall biosynthesis